MFYLGQDKQKCLQEDPELQTIRSTMIKVTNALKELYRLNPHPYIVRTHTGCFSKLSANNRIIKTWPFALEAIHVQQTAKLSMKSSSNTAIINGEEAKMEETDDTEDGNGSPQMRFLKECMTTLQLTPELVTYYGIASLHHHNTAQSYTSLASLVDAHMLIKTQSEIPMYGNDKDLKCVLGFMGYIVWRETGEGIRNEFEELLKGGDSSDCLTRMCRRTERDVNAMDVDELDEEEVLDTTVDFYKHKWVLLNRQETTEAEVESAKIVFSVDCWDDDAFEVLGVHHSHQWSNEQNVTSLKSLISLFIDRLECFNEDDRRIGLLWNRLAYSLKDCTPAIMEMLFVERRPIWKRLFYDGRPCCLYRYICALYIFRKELVFLKNLQVKCSGLTIADGEILNYYHPDHKWNN